MREEDLTAFLLRRHDSGDARQKVLVIPKLSDVHLQWVLAGSRSSTSR
jgi:hypothetical protein